MKRLAAVMMTSACVFVSCVEMDEQQSGEVGYLASPMLDVDVTVDDFTPTKSLDFEIEVPQVADITFEVKDKDGKVRYNGKGLWSEPLTLPVGSYSINATCGSNTFGSPYFTGTATGSVDPLESEVPALSLSLANSLVKVTVAESLTGHFTPGEAVVFNSGAYEAVYDQWVYVPSGSDVILTLSGKSSTDRDVTFTHTLSAPSPKVAYSVSCGMKSTDWPAITLSVKAEEAWASRVYITSPAQFSGNISAENQSAVVYEAIPSASSDWNNPAKAVTEGGVLVIKGLTPDSEYQVRARVGALVSNVVKVTPKVDGFSASAVHTNTNSELDGTDVTTTFSKPDVVKNGISSWTINLCKSDGTVLRSGLSLGRSDGSAITATDGWPYLPKGSYKLVGKAKMSETEEVDVEIPFTTSDPSFTVTASAYTTYDKYVEYTQSGSTDALNAANKEGYAEYIFQISSTVGISDKLLGNANYGTTKVYYTCGPYVDYERDFVNGEGDTDSAVKKNNIGDVGGFSWGANSLTAKVNFAGTEVTSAAHTCHVTGLPYQSPDFLTTSITMKSSASASVTDWVSNGTVEYWSGRGYELVSYYLGGVTAGNVFSPAFQTPSSTNISYTVPVCYFSTGLSNKTMDMYSGVTTNYTKVKTATTSISRVTSDDDPGINKFTSVSKDDVMVANGRISISTDEQKDDNWAQNWFTMASLTVKYRK